ncbi:DUF808 domain-containing protein [Corynebacterium anserum]|uniref:DUF808 family protein n=1 Tax=Corynebacterium anserum TaxID=2684406 RepID=A0A7G7YR61_9CORY|nr:DUF808 domain-containing protein [Corynebacterium anserum]MBC2681943.1 DUF808 family protein [Corynebacterium anserum]QNH96981.1 DUF808 family protein [Corynebacterium anserum]
MAIGLAALLDDVSMIARTAAASVDDIGAAVGKTSAKAAGVVVDDAAVTPKFVDGVTPSRELPIIWKITKGSLRNKLVIILPIALLLSAVAPWMLTPLLMCGGTYLCFEGAEKVIGSFTGHSDHTEPAGDSAAHGDTGSDLADLDKASNGSASHSDTGTNSAKDEDTLVKGAITTDFILSAEIMVISLNEVADLGFWMRALVLAIVGTLVTVLVYGVVGLLVKMDDAGLALSTKNSSGLQKIGTSLVKAMPIVLSVISVIGTAAMLWVGGHILLVGFEELFWPWPYETVHHIAEAAGSNGAVQWIITTFFSMVFGLLIGSIVVGLTHLIPSRKKPH